MKEIPVLINCLDKTQWEEVPDEDLWQDGEMHYLEIKDIIYMTIYLNFTMIIQTRLP